MREFVRFSVFLTEKFVESRAVVSLIVYSIVLQWATGLMASLNAIAASGLARGCCEETLVIKHRVMDLQKWSEILIVYVNSSYCLVMRIFFIMCSFIFLAENIRS